MPPGKRRFDMDGSWVVEGDDDSMDSLPSSDEPPPRQKATPRRQKRNNTKSPEPEFRMPRVDADESMEASWMDESRSTKLQRTPREAAGIVRRGIAKHGVNTERTGTQLSPKKASKNAYPKYAPSSLSSSVDSDFQAILATTLSYASMVFQWCLDIFGGSLRVLKTPITYILAVWMLFGAAIMIRNLVTDSIYASLSPICRVPGTSLLNLPFCPVYQVDNSNGPPPPPVEFEQLISVQSKFEEVLEKSAGGVSLPMDMKRGEASIRDLRQLVKYSQLHARNELVLEFDGFIETARIASYDLQRFNSHVGRAVDSVIATTRWTARVLDGIQEREASRGAINAFINDKLLAPFQAIKWSENILLDQYIKHTRIVEEEIGKLIAEAQAILMVLDNLDNRLEVIYDISSRENGHAKALKEEILSELWTMVGGNRGKINKMDRQLSLLQQVSVYRKIAFAHVSGTILRLQGIGAGLEDLRERVGAPELLRDRTDIPLAAHIESIQRGVERLEAGRQSARKLENEHIRQTLERSQMEGTLINK